MRLSPLLACLLAAGCREAPRERPQELQVFAAASLKDVFGRLADRFAQRHPGTRVVFNFAGSQELRTQISHGATADVFASADWNHMEALRSIGDVSDPVPFARNELVIVVPKGNPAGIARLADLPRAQRLVIGVPEVPVGRYTDEMLARTEKTVGEGFARKVLGQVASRELNVKQVLAKVQLGEADAGVVYRTDALAAAGAVEVVAIPPELNVVATYPIAALARAREPALARAFIELVVSPEGQSILAEAGFQPIRR